MLPSLYQFLVLLALGPLAVLTQGSLMISLIRNAFRKRGWLIRIG